MQATLHTYLSLGGLFLDFVGAALLAYDVLHGPEARFEAAVRRARLVSTMRNQERRQAQLQALVTAPNASEARMKWLKGRILELGEESDKTLRELKGFELHERRARRIALTGLVLLMAGFASQGLANALARLPADAPAARS